MEYPSLSDSLLLADFVRQGSEASFAEIVRRHEVFVRGVAARVLGDGPDAEDAAQAAFVALAFDARRVDASRGLGPWLQLVTVRAALDVRKSTIRRLERESVTVSPESTLSFDGNDGLDEAIERLPADQREAFLLQAEAGMRVEDIALATGVAFETAKSRLRYARSSLKQWLQEFA